jgi:GMP synthase-like glutamine amidotransferase
MRIQVLQHVPFEGPASLADDFSRRGYPVATTHWYAGDPSPALDSFDGLVVMGGPMGVNDEADFAWLAEEKALIRAAIEVQKPVLGICLGAQLIASALGAPVTRNPEREIGWFPLKSTGAQSPFADIFANNPEVFHWHGDTFALPAGAVLLAGSQACAHQAFSIGDRVLALQFHLETTEQSARALVAECSNELDASRYVQSAEEMLARPERFTATNQLMTRVVDRLFATPRS